MSLITKKICPECESDEIVVIDRSGIWMCKSCGYSGRNFNDGDIIEGDIRRIFRREDYKMKIKNKKGKKIR